MISFIKFDGEWVLKVTDQPAPQPGQIVTVTKKNGQTSTVTVTGSMCLTDGAATLISFDDAQPQTRTTRRQPVTRRTTTPRPATRDRCRACGRVLSDFDRRAACAPGYHFDCA